MNVILELTRFKNGVYGIKQWGDNGEILNDYKLKSGVPVRFKMGGTTDAELTLNTNTETLTGFYSTYTIQRGNRCYRGERSFNGIEMIDTVWYTDNHPTITTYQRI